MPNGVAPTDHKDSFQAAEQITRGNYHWGTTLGQPAAITYNFRSSVPDGYVSTDHDEGSTVDGLSVNQQTTVGLALQLWSDLANIRFSRTYGTNDATMMIGSYSSTTDGAAAFAQFPGSTASSDRAGDVWLNRNSIGATDPAVGRRSFAVVMHEIGHAIGLQHPGDYNAGPNVSITYENDALYVEDTNQYTVMSYFEVQDQPESPLLHDITAIQRLYGANLSTRTENTRYGYHSNIFGASSVVYNFASNISPNIAIYDAGGTDTFDVSLYNNNQTVDLHPGKFSSVLGLVNNVAMAEGVFVTGRGIINYIENAVGGGGDDTIYGNVVDNILSGGDGYDLIDADAGNDTINGDSGVDRLYGFTGDDTIYGGEDSDHLAGWYGADYLNGDAGNDTIVGEQDNDTLNGGDGNDVLGGGEGDDSVDSGNGNDVLNGDSGADHLYGWAGNDQMYGGSEKDFLIGWTGDDYEDGGEGDDYITGYEGDDTLVGGSGVNTLNAGEGNDFLIVGEGSDSMYGGDGFDTMVFTQATIADWQSGTLDASVANDVWNDWEAIQGSSGNDTIRTNSWGYSIKLSGGAGDDILATGLDQEVSDILEGEAGDDTLSGGGGSDLVSGGGGNDLLSGQSGADTLTGGRGRDQFIFETALGKGQRDKITDFNVKSDDIDLDLSIFTSLKPGGVLNEAAFYEGKAAHDKTDRIIYDDDSGRLFYDADGNGSGKRIQFAAMAAGLNLTNVDFFLI